MPESSKTVKLKYVKYERGYYYFRRGSTRLRLRGAPSDPDFIVDYAHALSSYEEPKAAVQPADTVILDGSFRDLAVAYMGSQDYLNLGRRTRQQYRYSIDLAVELLGHEDASDIDMPQILEIRDAYADMPGKANQLMKVIRIIYGWSIPRGRVKHNPADFSGTTIRKLGTGEHMPWPEDVLERFLAETTDRVRQVMLTCVLTGQRVGDVLMIRHADRSDDDVLYVKQQKTGKELYIPLHPDLVSLWDGMGRAGEYLFMSETGVRLRYNNFWSQYTAERRRILGAESSLKTHGLRKNAVIRMLMLGVTIPEAGSITGQTNETVNYYARQISQMKLAQTAMSRYAEWTRSEHSANKKVVNLY